MASKNTSEPGDGPVCTVCLQTPDVLKVVTTCKHPCCVECLSKHLKSLSSTSESFPCPICQEECPLVENGIDGLEDHKVAGEFDEESIATESVECLSCSFKLGTTVEAKSLCQECGNMCLCQECTQVHRKNPATANHVVISLKASKKETGRTCGIHIKEVIESYCSTCQKPCCRLCVLLDHGYHEVKKIWEEFWSVLEEVQRVSEEYEKRSNHMKRFEKQMQFLKNSEVSRKRDVLIREIEDHSEICIQRIIKKKEELKEKVQQDYQVVSEVYDWLAKFPALDKLDNAIAQSKTLVSKAEPHPHDIEKLSVIKRRIVDSELAKNIRMDKYMEGFTRLIKNPIEFVPDQSAQSIGKLVSGARNNKNIQNCKLVFEKELSVDDQAKFIPCVANLGNDFYAIAHPTVAGTPSNAIDIYKLPGDFQHTITDHVNPVYDIAATPDGQLAVLSDGLTKDSCSVRLFDPLTGEMNSTRDVYLRSPISFDVNIYNQFVILSKDDDVKVTIANENGSVESSDNAGIQDATRICCAGEKILLVAPTAVFDNTNSRSLMHCSQTGFSPYLDISANCFGEVNMCCVYDNVHHLKRCTIGDQSLMEQETFIVGAVTKGVNPEASLSVKGCYVVSSWGHALKVFEEIRPIRTKILNRCLNSN